MNPEPLYIIERHKYGWAIKSAPYKRGVPVEAFTDVQKLCEKDALIDSGIANSIEAIMVAGSPDDLKKWRDEIETELKEDTSLGAEAKWLYGTDTGISSGTIFLALADHKFVTAAHSRRDCSLASDMADTPHDSGDFGRCHRLLNLFPAWKDRLAEVGEKFPKWKRVVPAWAELSKLYEEGKLDLVTAKLRELNA